MAGLPRHKYDLLPFSTDLSVSSNSPLSYTIHRPSKREYIESSDVEDVPSSPPRKYRGRRWREWRYSSDIGNSSDIDEDDMSKVLEIDGEDIHHCRIAKLTNARGKGEDILSSQASQELSTSKFHRILSTAIMDGLDSVDFSYFSLHAVG